MSFIWELGGVSLVILVVAFSVGVMRLNRNEPRIDPDAARKLEAAAKWASTHGRMR